MREKIINYLTVQAMLDPDFEAPLMQKVRCALILAEKKYQTMNAEEINEIWQKVVDKEGVDDCDNLSQGNWD
jgi:hypothetical protein